MESSVAGRIMEFYSLQVVGEETLQGPTSILSPQTTHMKHGAGFQVLKALEGTIVSRRGNNAPI